MSKFFLFILQIPDCIFFPKSPLINPIIKRHYSSIKKNASSMRKSLHTEQDHPITMVLQNKRVVTRIGRNYMINITIDEKRELLEGIERQYRNMAPGEKDELLTVAIMLKLYEKNNGFPARNMNDLEMWYSLNKAAVDMLPDPEEGDAGV